MSPFQLLTRIPFFGDYIIVANAYAWSGQGAYTTEFAPVSCWVKNVLGKMIFAAMLALVIVYLRKDGIVQLPAGQDISLRDVLSVFPNLLGFAVALYAFVLVIPRRFWSWMRSKRGQDFSPLSVNADLAFPVISICLMLGVAWPMSLLEHKFSDLLFLTAFIFIYGFILLAELLVSIFLIAHKSLE